MSSVLTWKSSGIGTKTGVDSAAFITDFTALCNSKSGDASYLWQVASSNPTTTPLYLVLKRKNGSPGRILIVIWTSAPAGNNATILDQNPTSASPFIAWFPNGNVDTPSNLAVASGTIMGNDTGCTKVASLYSVINSYQANYVPFYFESAESVFFATQIQSSSGSYLMGAGDILVDALDNAYGGVYGCGNNSTYLFGASNQVPFISTKPNAGAGNSASIRTNYGSTDRVYYQAWASSASWAAPGSAGADFLLDSVTGKAFLVPVQLIGQLHDTKALDLKLRQMAYGPYASMAFAVINAAGPVTVAMCSNAANAGGGGYPWFTQFKI